MIRPDFVGMQRLKRWSFSVVVGCSGVCPVGSGAK